MISQIMFVLILFLSMSLVLDDNNFRCIIANLKKTSHVKLNMKYV